MGVHNFEIFLDRPDSTYYAGTVLSGNLQFYLDKPKNIRAVEVHFLGQGKASWLDTISEFIDGKHETRHVTFTATEEYISLKMNLAGSSESEMTLLPGEHVYPFSVTLPLSLPSSFQGEHGNVRYFVKARLNVPWRFDDKINKLFTVLSPINLNHIAQAKNPVQREAAKSFCCFWCRSGPLTLVLNLPYTGFVPGQIIPVTLEVDNASDVDVNNVIMKLVKVTRWTVHSPQNRSKTNRNDILKLSLGRVNKNHSRTYTQQLSVPNIPVFNLERCSIIKCDYVFKVELDVLGLHSSLSQEVPIYLGTVPLFEVGTALPYQSTIVPAVGQQQSIQPTAPPQWVTFAE